MLSKEEEEFRKIAAELRLLESTAEAVQSRINFVNAALTELNLAKMNLEGLEKEKIETSLLVPIGGGSYIKAKIESTEKIVVGIGAGVAVEKTFNEAKEILSKRIEELEKLYGRLQQQLAQIGQKIKEDRAKLEEISRSITRRQQPSV
ncbi:MAG TPA: prefoldin subunit alpha [Candidatus Bathyarchaeota archaeon]|nr:prefoldin subunit alpha [Candidatus Bathyarchaeota archaeon]